MAGRDEAKRDELAAEVIALTSPSTALEKFADGASHLIGSGALPALTQAEREAIDDWVRGNPYVINGHLRGTLPPGEAAFYDYATAWPKRTTTHPANLNARIAAINNAMNRLPDYNGVTYRRSGYANVNVYRPGGISPGDYVSESGFLASSTVKGGEGAAAGWGSRQEVYFAIKGVHGKDISSFSKIQGEREVLFASGTIFKIDAISEDNGAFFVIMHEVEKNVGGKTVKNPYDGT